MPGLDVNVQYIYSKAERHRSKLMSYDEQK